MWRCENTGARLACHLIGKFWICYYITPSRPTVDVRCIRDGSDVCASGLVCCNLTVETGPTPAPTESRRAHDSLDHNQMYHMSSMRVGTSPLIGKKVLDGDQTRSVAGESVMEGYHGEHAAGIHTCSSHMLVPCVWSASAQAYRLRRATCSKKAAGPQPQ